MDGLEVDLEKFLQWKNNYDLKESSNEGSFLLMVILQKAPSHK